MKPTEDQLDQLLSAYLDHALDHDELLLVEQWLKQDLKVSQRLRELTAVRDSVRQAFNSPPTERLPQGFSTEVLAAAVARAYEEGCDESHPLMRVQENPLTTLDRSTGEVSTRRLAVVALTLAASVLFLVLGSNLLEPVTGKQGDSLAKTESDSLTDGVTTPFDSSKLRVVDLDRPDRNSSGSLDVVVADQELQGNDSIESNSPAGGVTLNDIADGSGGQTIRPEVNSESSSDNTMEVVQDLATDRVFEGAASPKGAILVLRIKQTDIGRSGEAVRRAMESAGIRGSSQVALNGKTLEGLVAQTSDVQGTVRQEDGVGAGRSVLFLQLSAKQFDRFYQQVWGDQTGVDSLSMSVAFDAPIIGLIESIVHDPTLIKAEATSVEIREMTDQGFLVDSLQQLQSVPMDRTVLSVPSLGSGEDLQTQVLLLVE